MGGDTSKQGETKGNQGEIKGKSRETKGNQGEIRNPGEPRVSL